MQQLLKLRLLFFNYIYFLSESIYSAIAPTVLYFLKSAGSTLTPSFSPISEEMQTTSKELTPRSLLNLVSALISSAYM